MDEKRTEYPIMKADTPSIGGSTFPSYVIEETLKSWRKAKTVIPLTLIDRSGNNREFGFIRPEDVRYDSGDKTVYFKVKDADLANFKGSYLYPVFFVHNEVQKKDRFYIDSFFFANLRIYKEKTGFRELDNQVK